jgi:uncharacterized membrane protein YhaH (DUF805 family)
LANVIELFTSFHGRISRKSWWIGYVILMVLGWGGQLLINPGLFTTAVPQPDWAATIWAFFLLIPFTAIMVKRFNDGDWPNWLGYAIALIFVLLNIASHFGGATKLMFYIVVGIGGFLFIVNGFLRGTRGPNRYGPDPLQIT